MSDWDLRRIAKTVQQGGRQTMIIALQGMLNPSGYEVQERGLQYGAFNALAAEFASTPGWDRPRVFAELAITAISNLPEKCRTVVGLGHPFDLAVAWPIESARELTQNLPCMGLIEFKRSAHDLMSSDIPMLSDVANLAASDPGANGDRTLQWIMGAGVVRGRNFANIDEKIDQLATKMRSFGLTQLTDVLPVDPFKLPHMPQGTVDDRFFDVVCFGKSV